MWQGKRDDAAKRKEEEELVGRNESGELRCGGSGPSDGATTAATAARPAFVTVLIDEPCSSRRHFFSSSPPFPS